jgi:uncharacterized membrane protein YedE/YeeE
MRYIKFFFAGVLFGIIMVKSEAFSWYRIQEMFHFRSFHMFGIIGVAVVLGILMVSAIKRYQIRDFTGQPIVFTDKTISFWRYALGGTIFGLGWALSGACPGPMFVNLGYGVFTMGIVIAGAWLGTMLYGLVRNYLPH